MTKYLPVNSITSPSERRAVTPAGTKVFGGTSNRSPSTCPKPSESGYEGRLKPPFAGNVDIPLAGAPAESLRPDRSRRRNNTPLGKSTCFYVAVYINAIIKGDKINEKALSSLICQFYSAKAELVR